MKEHLRTVETDLDALIPLRVAAAMLGLDTSSLRKRAAGTESLTLVPQGRKLFMVRREVIAHRQKMIDDARLRNNIPLRLVQKR